MTSYAFYVNSADANSVYSQSQSFSDNLYSNTQTNALAEAQGYEIALSEVLIPNVEYNINSNNYTFSWQETNSSGSTYSINIPQGIYNASSLTSALQSAMNAAGALYTYTCSYNASSYVLTISANASYVFSILAASTILGVLGYASTSSTGKTTSFANQQVGLYPVNTLGTKFYDIVLSYQCNSFTTNALYGNVLDRVLMSVPTGQVQYYQYVNPRKVPIRAQDLSGFQIRVFNDQGCLASISPNFSYVLKLLITPAGKTM